MNPSEVAELGDLILRLQGLGKTILLVEHHMRLVMRVADRITVLSAGRVIADGTPAEVRRDTGVIAAYLGGAA
jgi:branched-chain amino acid transport system ATP-binding protein